MYNEMVQSKCMGHLHILYEYNAYASPVGTVEQFRRRHTGISVTLAHTCADQRGRTLARQVYASRLV